MKHKKFRDLFGKYSYSYDNESHGNELQCYPGKLKIYLSDRETEFPWVDNNNINKNFTRLKDKIDEKVGIIIEFSNEIEDNINIKNIIDEYLSDYVIDNEFDFEGLKFHIRNYNGNKKTILLLTNQINIRYYLIEILQLGFENYIRKIYLNVSNQEFEKTREEILSIGNFSLEKRGLTLKLIAYENF